MAFGMAVSRLFQGKQVDKGRITQIIILGLYFSLFLFFSLSLWDIDEMEPEFTTVLFFVIALLLGVGFGTMFPAFNSLFVSLAPNSKRGTATSTLSDFLGRRHRYWSYVGGYIAQITSFDTAYFFRCPAHCYLGIVFKLKVTPHFETK